MTGHRRFWATGDWLCLFLCLSLALVAAAPARAAGLLKAMDGGDLPVAIRSHQVEVVINNGFARTEIDQLFANTGDRDLEALYTFPLPKQASLSELSLWIDGAEVIGEVVEKERARQLYNEQKAQGLETALAEKKDFQSFEIAVGRIPAGGEARVRLVYYQPLEIDLNVGRYLYPLAEGNVDEERLAFWAVDDQVSGPFRFHLQLKSAFPLRDVRLPGLEAEAVVQKAAGVGEGAGEVWDVTLERPEGSRLASDIVFYYRLDDAVPARVELVPYRADPGQPGTFMVVVTPAADLQRIAEGTDWVFILDVSGSMSGGKIATLADGVGRVLGKLSPNDRFRLITFNDNAHDLTGGFLPATPAQVQEWIARTKGLQAGGSTNLFAGLELGYRRLDDDRTTGVVLITDGVANVGPTEHADFLRLLRQHDLRLFTYVIGNSANQPLLERMASESGGFAMNLSESDDIAGRLLQARARMGHECLHDVRLAFQGEKVKDLTPARPGNLYLGQQLVMFGRYTGSGPVEVELQARISGQERSWRTTAELPETDGANPELERLWALSRIDDVMAEVREKGESESLRGRVVELGKAYSLVTDYTSMIVVRQEVFESAGIDRANARRVATERQAQQARAQAPVQSYQVDRSGGGMFKGLPSPGIGSGPVGPLFVPLAAWLAWRNRNRK